MEEGIEIVEAVNDFIDEIFLAKTIYKEQKAETNLATKPEASIAKPNLTDILKLCKFKIDGKIEASGEKDKLTFMSLIYQIQNDSTKQFKK